MDIIYVFNGLGNQMSQYALYLHKRCLGQKVKCLFENTDHNGIELDRLFGVNIKGVFYSPIVKIIYYIFAYQKMRILMNPIRILLNILGMRALVEAGKYDYNEDIINSHDGLTIITGGWHHYKYFEGFESVIKAKYKFPPFSDKRNKNVMSMAKDKNAVAVHIRRGDYVNSNKFGLVCNEDYYKNCITYYEKLIKTPVFYVFSNDMEWSKLLFDNKQAVFIDWNKGINSWADMALMSSFKNIIIANSTFSWWAAWLGNCDIVLCPPCLVYGDPKSDIFPPEWIRIKN